MVNSSLKIYKMPYNLQSGAHIFFENEKEQQTFFSQIERYNLETSYNKNIAQVKVDIPFEELETNCNYLSFMNPNGKIYYCWVLSLSYISPNTTAINYSCDVIQTYMFDIDFTQQSYIDRRHWSYKHDDMQKLLMLPDENLEIGAEYNIVDRRHLKNADFQSSWYLLVSSEEFGNVVAHQTGMSAVPKEYVKMYSDWIEISNNTSISDIEVSMLNYYIIDENGMNALLNRNVLTNTTNNGKVVQLTILPVYDEDLKNVKNGIAKNYIYEFSGGAVNIGEGRLYRAYDVGMGERDIEIEQPFYLLHDYYNRLRLNKLDTPEFELVQVYISEHKEMDASAISTYFYKSPFTILETNDYSSNVRVYKPELIYNNLSFDALKNNKALIFYQTMCLLNVFEMRYVLSNYQNNVFILNKATRTMWSDIASSMYASIQGYVNLPVVNDYTSAYMQSNANQIQAQYKAIQSTSQTNALNINASAKASLYGAEINATNSQISAQTSLDNNVVSNNASMMQANIGAVANGVSMIGNLASGNVGGAVSNLVGGASSYANSVIGVQASQEMASNSYSSANTITANSLVASQYAINTNTANQLRTNSLNAMLQTLSLNAKMQDIENVPNTVAVSGNGSGYTLMSGLNDIVFEVKAIKPDVYKRLETFFTLYGLYSKTFESVKSIIDKFDVGGYIKTSNAYINGDIPQEHLNSIKLTFDMGCHIFKGADNLYNWEGVRKQ